MNTAGQPGSRILAVGQEAKYGRNLGDVDGSKAAVPVQAAIRAAGLESSAHVAFLNAVPISNHEVPAAAAPAAGAPPPPPPPTPGVRDRHSRNPTADELLAARLECTPEKAARLLFAAQLKALREAGIVVAGVVLLAPITGCFCEQGGYLS
jgi:hypothetical protein